MTTLAALSLIAIPGASAAGESGAAEVGASSAVPGAASANSRVSAPESSERERVAAGMPSSTSATVGARQSRSGILPTAAYVVHGERCKSARKASVYYRAKTWTYQTARGAKLGDRTPVVAGKTCRWARYAASVWQARAKAARASWERYRTLRDFDVRPGYSGWQMAVDEVQRAFPGTKAWLLSCSASEGGWGRWVWNTQGSGCGGWLQFMHPTFVGFSARALADVRRRGFRVPDSARSWLSPLGQALAGAWAYRAGLAFHWYGRGC